MSMFVAAAALLVVLGLGITLYPLWRARPLLGAGLGLALGLATLAIYLAIGAPRALDPQQSKPPQTLADAIVQLEAELQRDPRQIEGWRLLGSAYTAENQTQKARDAYARAVALAPDNPDLLAEAAEARALATDDRRFDAQAVRMLQHALKQQPMHQRARWFLGIAHRQGERPAEAAQTWEPLLGVVDAGTAASLLEQINGARQEAGLPPLPAPAAAAPPGLKIKVELAPALAARVPAGASLFVLARQADGRPMPVAVEKLAATKFPMQVVLDDGDSPMPTAKLSQLERVQVLARISASGNAMPQTGDLASAPVVVQVRGNAAEIVLRIDRAIE
ncbi:tetratricopeptide repeat protein [Lysobacter firmicutimachus]|uniref:Tetratricopeptide repeat protein n=1 Tax=Lysobacter firmicutimachus TaxID=1792846 RepID=A0AAU8MQ94_9GAMM|nr:tetratricopeptide repeat protein [Lysobacter antibioticus]